MQQQKQELSFSVIEIVAYILTWSQVQWGTVGEITVFALD
jgi:hypothetical protein